MLELAWCYSAAAARGRAREPALRETEQGNEPAFADTAAAEETDLIEWRRKATHFTLVTTAIAYLPGLALHVFADQPPVPWPVDLWACVVYAIAVVGALLPRTDHRRKLWPLLSAAYLLAVLGVASQPQGPFVRAMPFILAMVALVLIGPRAGRVFTLAACAVALLAPLLPAALPDMTPEGTPEALSAPLPSMIAQGAVLTGSFLCIIVLLEHYHRFLVRTLESRNLAAARLNREASECRAAHRELQHAMDEMRRLEREVARAGDDERRNLGNDVHDGVCQVLTGAVLRCQALKMRLDRGQDLAADDLSALSSLLEEAMDEAHAVARGLCPLEPDAGALAPALGALAKRTEATAGIECRFSADGDVSVPDPGAAQHLYRIAQEAVSNALRHAKASSIAVELRRQGDDVVLRIRDDGTGIRAGTGAGGMGLRTMAYRAHILDGQISVEQADGGGTLVECRVPRSARAGTHYEQRTSQVETSDDP